MCVRNFSVFFFNFRDRNGRFLFGILTAKGVISQHRNPNKLEVISKTKAPPLHICGLGPWHLFCVCLLLAITGPTSCLLCICFSVMDSVSGHWFCFFGAEWH